MKRPTSPLAWLATLAGLIVLVVSLMSCGSSGSSTNISNTPSSGNTSTNTSSSSSSGTSVVQTDATSTATFNANAIATNVVNATATATASVPTPTPTVEPTQPAQIIHNFSCTQQVYYDVKVPAYPEILTVSFIQVTTAGDAVTDYIKIQAAQDTPDTFQWTLASTGETQTITITNPTVGAINFGVTVLSFSKAVVNPDGSFGTQNFYVAGICSSWSSDGVPVTQ